MSQPEVEYPSPESRYVLSRAQSQDAYDTNSLTPQNRFAAA